MSKADNIQRKIDKAYSIVAKQLGRPFEIYRASTLDDPLQSQNYINTQLATFTIDDKFAKPPIMMPPKKAPAYWIAWIDGQLDNLFSLQAGDILHDNQNDETYIMVGMYPHLLHQAITADNMISIQRVSSSVYGDDDGTGFAPGNVSTNITYATNVPCQILQINPNEASGYVPVSSKAKDIIPNYDIYLIDKNKEIKVRDIITDDMSNIMEVQSVHHSKSGTRAMCIGVAND